jgi:hypothetical protein
MVSSPWCCMVSSPWCCRSHMRFAVICYSPAVTDCHTVYDNCCTIFQQHLSCKASKHRHPGPTCDLPLAVAEAKDLVDLIQPASAVFEPAHTVYCSVSLSHSLLSGTQVDRKAMHPCSKQYGTAQADWHPQPSQSNTTEPSPVNWMQMAR